MSVSLTFSNLLNLIQFSGASFVMYFEYGDDEIPAVGGHSALSILKMKGIALTSKQRSELVGSLSLDEKRYFGNWLNDNEYNTNAVEEVGGELDGQLSFGNTTYEDGVQVYTNNKY